MLEGLQITARQTLVLFLLMAFGAGARWTRILDGQSVKKLTDFVLIIVTPCLIVTSFQRPFDTSALAGLGIAFVSAFACHLLGILYSHLGVRDRNEVRKRQLCFATAFSNAGFMGFPLEYALLGPDGVFYGSVYVVVFHLLCWTYGVWEIRGGFGDTNVALSFVNPGVVGIALGFPLFLLSWKLPGVIAEPVKTVGDLNTSLSMVVTGFHLGGARFSAALACPWTYLTLGLRHLLVPATAVAVLFLFPGIDTTVRLATVIPAAAPVGASVTMFSVRYGLDGEFPAALVAVSTLLSILTMPVVVGIAKSLYGG